jgi:mevalonate kinase
MARACGKVILLGEHAVVYGVPAIAVGIQRGAEAHVRPSRVARLRLGEHTARPGDGTELGRAFAALLAALGGAELEVDVTLELPPGCGLGASAAIAVAVARAVQEFTQVSPVADADGLTLRAAEAWEQVFHGNPSGIDAAASAVGGCLRYVRGRGAEPLPLGRSLSLAVAVAGPPASTRQMVETVGRLREAQPDHVASVLRGIQELVNRAPHLLAQGAWVELGQLLDRNHAYLQSLGVSTPRIDQACTVARRAGALGAKLTGSGGGGAVFTLVDGNPEEVLAAWKAHGFEGFATEVSTNQAPPH